MSANTNAPPWTAEEVFGPLEYDECECCCCCPSCCVPYKMPVILFADSTWITDKYVMVHRHLVDDDTIPDLKPMPSIKAETFTPPDAEPPTSTTTFTEDKVVRLLALGLDIREGRNPRKPQPLYRDSEHVGWIMPALRGKTLAEVQS